jgi:glycosyltransferase involved in cell wall biosynthesis
MIARPHITVCVCTYKRPALLGRLLQGLADQETGGLFDFSLVVADNDAARSAESMVRTFADRSGLQVTYCVEPRQNIALARNRAIEHASGDYVAFLDDDEFPSGQWLQTLFTACRTFGVDGVLGPVKPHFDEPPPAWVIGGRFYDRPSYPTGTVIDWPKGRTGNVLMKRAIFAADPEPFRPEFLTGEDQDFFRRMIGRGHVFVWCDEAVAYEVVPPVRWERGFMIRRALLRGAVSLMHPTVGAPHIGKSLVAVPAYCAALPFALCAGQAPFMKYLVKLCDHAGRLLALVGIRPIRQPYVTD